MLRNPATPIPPIEPTRREARLHVLRLVALWGCMAAAQWLSVLALVVPVAFWWEMRAMRDVLRRVEPDAGWWRTSDAFFEPRTEERFARATGWPPALVRAGLITVFVGAFGLITWWQWFR